MRVLTSWDDGHPCDLRVAELLDRHGLGGTFFVPARNSEGRGVMGDVELRDLDQRYEIGAHTLTHAYLLGLPQNQAMAEIVDGKQALEQILGHPVQGFCYPGGKFGVETVQCVKSAGFLYSRTTENMRFSLGRDPFRMPTTLQCFPHEAAVLARNCLRRPGWGKIGILRARAQAQSYWTFLPQIAEICARRDGIFHLWGHSWEVEAHGLWQRLDDTLAMLAGFRTDTTSLAQASTRWLQTDRPVR
jgi:hypothetical protein